MSDGLSRRSFLKLAATASAAAAIPGCEPAARKLIPYVVPDENVIPGRSDLLCHHLHGVLRRMRSGRRGDGGAGNQARGQSGRSDQPGCDLRARAGRAAGTVQSRSLGRSQDPPVGWHAYRNPLGRRDQADERQARGGGASRQGSCRLYRSAAGPDAQQRRQSLGAQAYNSVRVGFWEALSDEPAERVVYSTFGRRDLPIYKLDQAETIISFGADFVETWRSPVEYARQFAQFRAPKTRRGTLSIGRAAYVGPRLNSTAAKCDEWVASNPGTEGAVAMAVLNVVVNQGWVAANSGRQSR